MLQVSSFQDLHDSKLIQLMNGDKVGGSDLCLSEIILYFFRNNSLKSINGIVQALKIHFHHTINIQIINYHPHILNADHPLNH